MTDPRFGVAVHEAAHVAGHLAQGLHVASVAIAPRAFTDHGPVRPEYLTADELFKYCVATFAGPAAVHVLGGSMVSDGGSADERDARLLAKQWRELSGALNTLKKQRRDSDAWLTRARVCALALVVRHESGIRAIADALLDYGALHARQLRDLWFQLQHPAAALLIAGRAPRALRPWGY